MERHYEDFNWQVPFRRSYRYDFRWDRSTKIHWVIPLYPFVSKTSFFYRIMKTKKMRQRTSAVTGDAHRGWMCMWVRVYILVQGSELFFFYGYINAQPACLDLYYYSSQRTNSFSSFPRTRPRKKSDAGKALRMRMRQAFPLWRLPAQQRHWLVNLGSALFPTRPMGTWRPFCAGKADSFDSSNYPQQRRKLL